MTAKKTAEEVARRYRVARAFKHEGVLITSSVRLASLPQAVIDDRVKRGYLEDRQPAASETAPAAKAKE